MSKYLILLAIAFASVLTACDGDSIILNAEQQYVVEGWIDSGDYPIVMITKTMPIDYERYEEEDLINLIVPDANVRVVCDGDTVELQAEMNPNYFPPIIYTTKQLKGQPHHTYKLLIDTSDGQQLSAVTTIPDVAVIDNLTYSAIQTCDTLFQLTLRFHDNPSQKNYYKLFTRTKNPRFADSEEGYYSSYFTNSFLSPVISCFDDATLDSDVTVNFTRGFMNYVKDPNIYFLSGDEVEVKFAQIDAESFRFWDEQQNQMLFGTNYMFHGTRNNETTIKGGLGSWCGYGAAFQKIVIP